MASAAGTARQSHIAKNDNFVEAQLDKARRRIRTLDLTTALLGLVAGVLTFAVLMALFDFWFDLNTAVRLVCFAGFAVAVLTYVGWTIVRPLTQTINPYYAARKVEETVPNAKNSVVNWLDLHDDEKLNEAIQQAVGQKAARDLAKVDLERAVSGRRAGWAGVILGVVMVVFIISLISMRASKFFSHVGRALFPFANAAARHNTEVTLLLPEDGDLTVTEEQDVAFRVLVEGRKPESVTLRTWVLPEDPESETRMDQEADDSRCWSIVLRGKEIKSPGFFYRVAGGDGSTEIHRVTVRSSPMIDLDKFSVTYKSRPYLGQKRERVVTKQRSLDGYRGTEVTLDVATNRNLRSGRLTFSADRNNLTKTYDAAIDGTDSRTMRFQFTLEESGKYAISFLSTDNESYSELHHRVTVKQDLAPTVELKVPGQDVTYPANDFVELEGVARDDIGVKEITLRMKVVAGQDIQPKPFREDKDIRFEDGGYPLVLDYKDILDLSSLKDTKGQPVKLKPGEVVEYWLETKDNCDYPAPNVAESKHFRVTISEPRDDKKKEEQKKQAEQRKEDHKKQQDEKRQEENKKREDQAKKDEKEREDKEKEEKKENQGKEGGSKDKKEEGKEGNRENKNDPEQKKREEQAKKDAEKLNDAAKKHEQEQRDQERGKGKDDKEEKGKAKEDEQKNNDKKDNKDGKGQDKQDGDKKEQGRQGEGKPNKDPMKEPGKEGGKEGEKKDEQPKNTSQGKQGDGKEEQKTGEAKDGQKQEGTEKQAEAKDGKGQEQKQQQAQRGEGKGGDKKEGQQQAGQPEDDGGMMGEAAQAKGGEKQGEQKQQAQGKGEGPKENHADAKANPKDGQGQPQAQGKGSEKKDQQAQGGGKDGAKEKGQETASGKNGRLRGDTRNQEQKPAAEANKGDVEEAAGDLKSKKAEDREAARKRLDDIKKNSQDGQAREAAEEALKKDGQGQGAAEAKQQTGGEKKEQQASAKGGEGQQATGKGGDPKPQGAGKGGDPMGEKKEERAAGKGAAPGDKQSRDLAKDTKDAADEKSNDPKKQKEAEEKAAKAFEKMLEDLKSQDAERREQAQNALRELGKRAKEDPNLKKGVEEKLMPGNVKKALDELAKDMKSDDPAKQEAAKNAIDELKKFGEDHKQGMSKEEQKKLDDLEKQANAGKQGTGGKAAQNDKTLPGERDPSKSDGRFNSRAGELQLDRFSESVKKKIIEDSGLTPKQIENIRQWQKRVAEKEKEERAATEGDKALGTDGIGQVKRDESGKEIQSNDNGKTPREYVDFYKNFTKKFTEAQQGAKDK